MPFCSLFHFREFKLSAAPSGNETSKRVQNTCYFFTLPLSNAQKILWTDRYHFANTLSDILAVFLLASLLLPLCKGVFFVLGVCFQEAQGLTSFLDVILVLAITSLNKHCIVTASPRLVSGSTEGISLRRQRGWSPEPCFWFCRGLRLQRQILPHP